MEKVKSTKVASSPDALEKKTKKEVVSEPKIEKYAEKKPSVQPTYKIPVFKPELRENIVSQTFERVMPDI